ncbi:MAG: ParB/RepB/Spo0J family partition protein [Terracidiphilus sp.]
MSKTIALTNSEYRNLPLAQLQESPTNPRRRFDERSLNELAESFKSQGVLQPLLVRSIGEELYEVVAGARRLRAAKLAELSDVPVRVVALSDAAVRESQLTENLLREDVHPYEEAIALKGILQLEGAQYDIASLSARLGKSQSYITQRIRLSELHPSIAEAFLADRIGVGHALEIAKLPLAQQEKAFDAAFRTVWSNGKENRILLPVRELAAWIEQNILLSLDNVPFDKNDAALVPEAGSCAECPKRTGFNTLLFGTAVHDACTDGTCYNNKLAKHIERQIAEKPKLVQITTGYGTRGVDSLVLGRNSYVALNLAKPAKAKQPLSANQKPCKQMAEAIVVDGAERGHTVKVCLDTNCPVHFADRASKTPDPAQVAREREKRRREIEKRKLEITIRHRILAEVLRKVGSPLERGDLVFIAEAMLEKTEPLRREALARRHKMVDGTASEVTYPQVQKGLQRLLRQLDESGLSKIIVEIILLGSVESVTPDETDALTAAARRHRVDVAKVRTTLEAEFAAKLKKAEAKQKQPVKPAKKGAAKAPAAA